MPRKTVNPDEVSMRKHGAHVWTSPDAPYVGHQEFWCFCDIGEDHTEEPRFS